mgnify:CR=1 FL=1
MEILVRIVKAIVTISAGAGILAFIRERFEKKNDHKPYGIYEAYIKRPLDVFLATGALIVLSPVIGIVAVQVRIKLGTPIFFKQRRPGKDEKVFCLIKFRSMTDEKDSQGRLLPDEKRLTNLGKMLRSTSLDELPELLNIIKGDMSIVGPRPLLLRYLPYFTESERHRHDVRPGLTGVAQTSGRNLLTWNERFELDILYVNNISFLRDLGIVWKTVKTVLSREDIITSGTEASIPDLDEERKC